MEDNMFYYLYQITNKVNNKIYVGVHKTQDMNDGYMGSGKVIVRAIEKYGIDNFEKVILETFEDSESMYAREKEVVTDEFLLREDIYNLRRGGHGGFDYINKNVDLFEIRSSNAKKIPYESKRNAGKRTGLLNKEKWRKDPTYHPGNFTKEFNLEMSKRAWSESAKEKRKVTRIKNSFQQGSRNSQFGTVWIWHELIGNKKIKKELLVYYIDQGWYKMYKPDFNASIV